MSCVTPDGRFALVTSSSTDRVAVVDLNKLVAMLKSASPRERQHVIPNHTGKPAEYVVKHIPTQTAPRGHHLFGGRQTAYVASMLDDSVTVIDVKKLEAVGRVDLGGSKELTKRRRGETTFPQRQRQLPPAVLVQQLPPGRAHRQHRLRHRGRRHRHGAD